MLERLKTRLLLAPEDLLPSDDRLNVVGVFNPAAARIGDKIVLLARVAEAVAEKRDGCRGFPRHDADSSELVVDWFCDDEIDMSDPRVARVKKTGCHRLTFVSHLRVFYCDQDLNVTSEGGRFSPRGEMEAFGVEDPRATWMEEEGRWLVTYVGVSLHGVSTFLAQTKDFRVFERLGLIFHPENKDVAVFPGRVGGRYAALHRPTPATPFCTHKPWIAFSDDLLKWGGHKPLFNPCREWELGRTGGGPPPIRTPEGWLALYHGNRKSSEGGVGEYTAGALLLDLEDPARVIGRTAEPILGPEEDFERGGFVDRVIFPTGVVERDGAWLIFYGAADRAVGVVEMRRDDILASVKG